MKRLCKHPYNTEKPYMETALVFPAGTPIQTIKDACRMNAAETRFRNAVKIDPRGLK